LKKRKEDNDKKWHEKCANLPPRTILSLHYCLEGVVESKALLSCAIGFNSKQYFILISR